MRRWWLLAYDIREPRRLQRVHRAVRAFGMGGQKSVHECWLSARERAELRRRLIDLLDRSRDRLLMIRLDPRARPRQLGRGTVLPEPRTHLID